MRWSGVVVLMLALAGLAAGCGDARETTPGAPDATTDGERATANFQPSVSVQVADARAGAASDVTLTYRLPAEVFPRFSSIDVPGGWDFSAWRGRPGVIAGIVSSDLYVGVANGPCEIPVHAEYRLLLASADGETISTREMSRAPHPDIYRLDSDGLPNGVTRVPAFLRDLDLEGTPYARAYGQSLVHTFPTYVNLVVQETSDGLTMEFILNDPSYSSPMVTALCGPLGFQLTLFGVSPSQPDAPLLVNPSEPGTYKWTVHSAPAPDADDDGIDNAFDNCALDANIDQADSDGDAIGDVCDPSREENRNGGDEDLDQYKNAADRCPLRPDEDQPDADLDFIGDECDDEPDTGRAGEVVVAASEVSLSAAPAVASALPSPPELASLPPVYDPDARALGEPNPSAPEIDPADAPQQATGLAHALGRLDCPGDWLAVRAAGDWSVCHPPEWEYRQGRAWMAGIWQERFSLYLGVPATDRDAGRSMAGIAIHHQKVGPTGALLPQCDAPEPGTLAGLDAAICNWPGGSPAGGGSAAEAIAYYVDFGNGRIALEGIAYDGGSDTMEEIVSIFETLRLP